MQLRVNDKTREFDLAREEKEDLTPDAVERVRHIASMQAEVEDLTRTMAEKMKGEEP
jgi:hypothetical protein